MPLYAEPPNHDPEVHLPASAIKPYPVPGVVFLLFALVIGLAFAGVGVGTSIALHKVSTLTKRSDDRNASRDKEHTQVEKQISSLVNQFSLQQKKDHQAVCLALHTALAGDTRPDPVLRQLNKGYGCR
jgi:hypothetical protein